MLKWLKLSRHHHSGRILAHDHTSYGPLMTLLLFVGVALTGFTSYALSPSPQSGSIGLTGSMPGTPPATAATVDSPSDQQRFAISPVTISGTCPTETIVAIYKNDIFAGSTPCSTAGIYSLDVDLLIGENTIIARVYDALDQVGPDSNSVTLFYDALPAQGAALNALNFGGDQLVISTPAIFRGTFPDAILSVPITILGGVAPYAVNIQWGDATNKLLTRNDNSAFNVGHAYAAAGTYSISIQASDSTGRVGFLTVAAIVNGQVSVVSGTGADSGLLSNASMPALLALWPLYVSLVAVMISFWLGERREKHILTHRHAI